MRERGIGDLEWVDREGRKKLLKAKKDVKTSTICTYIKISIYHICGQNRVFKGCSYVIYHQKM